MSSRRISSRRSGRSLSESLQGVIAQTLVPKIGGGRVAALEIMTTTAAVKNLIREGKTFQLPSIIETNSNLGMITLGQALQALVVSGTITPENAVIKGLDPALVSALRIATPPAMNGNGHGQSAPRQETPAPSFPKPGTLDDDDELGSLSPLTTPFSFQR